MSRDPVRAVAPHNELRFPFNLRIALAGWRLLFLRKGPFEPVGQERNPESRRVPG